MNNIVNWQALSKERKGAVIGAATLAIGALIDFYLIEGGAVSFTTWFFASLSALFLGLSIFGSEQAIRRVATLVGYSPV